MVIEQPAASGALMPPAQVGAPFAGCSDAADGGFRLRFAS
jgi:hypothetical protein